MGLNKKYFARDLYKKYGDNIDRINDDYEFLNSEKSGTLMYCSYFKKYYFLLFFFFVFILSLIFLLTSSYVVTGWIFLIGIVLIGLVLKVKWEIRGNSLLFTMPLVNDELLISSVKSINCNVNRTRFILTIESDNRIIIMNDTSLSNILSIYNLFRFKQYR